MSKYQTLQDRDSSEHETVVSRLGATRGWPGRKTHVKSLHIEPKDRFVICAIRATGQPANDLRSLPAEKILLAKDFVRHCP